VDAFEERLAQLDADVEAARKRAASATAFRQGTEEVRGRGTKDGIEVVVDSAGSLVDVDLGEDLKWARDAILAAYRQARQDAGRAVVALAQENLGEDDPSIARLQETYGITNDDAKQPAKTRRQTGLWRPGGSL